MTKETLADIFPDPKLAAIARLSDEEFMARAEERIAYLPEALRESAQRLIGGIQLDLPVKPSKVVFIPISHSWSNQAAERRMKLEMKAILQVVVKQGSLLANGESSSKVLSSQSMVESDAEMTRTLFNLGIINADELQKNLSRCYKISYGYEQALVDYLARHRNTKAIGVGSFDGGVVSVGLLVQAAQGNISNTTQHLEIFDYLTYEGRTRFALGSASSHLHEGQDLIFIQGAGHHYGVEEWCRRNSVSYVPMVAPGFKS